MTQTLDGSPLPEEHTLDDLPLGRADALKTGNELAILGFPSPAPGMAIIAHPVFGTFSVIDRSAADGPWIRLGEAPPEHPGHSGGPVLNRATGEVVGWCVRSQRGRVDVRLPPTAPKTGEKVVVPVATELRPVESLMPELAAVLEALDSSRIIEVGSQ